MTNKLVFLGGTCGKNTWRPTLIAQLVAEGVNPSCLFDPVVSDWNDAAQKAEEEAKAKATHMFFYIANPYLKGTELSAYSMVEATMALYDKPQTTVIVFDSTDITEHSLKAFKQTEKVLRKRFPQATILGTRQEAIDWLVKQLNPVEVTA